MIFRVETISDSELDNLLNKYVEELGHIFNMTWTRNRPNVYTVKDRKTINLIKCEETPDWLVGWSEGKDIFLLEKESFESESCHTYSEKEYSLLLKHELVHSFCNVKYPWFRKPLWLSEGIAIYLSGQCETKKKVCKFEKFLEYIENGGEKLYAESGFAVGILIENFGWEKMAELLCGLRDVRSDDDFEELFEKTYGFRLEYENFNEKLENHKTF